MSPTAALSSYIADALARPLPAAVAEKTKHHLLDTLAAMVSGSKLKPGRMAISYVKTLGGKPEARVAGTSLKVSSINAALANGMLAHADETDDSHARSQTHPGCGIVPAALAMAERERRSGKDLLRAVALGYDVSCRLTMALGAIGFRAEGHSTHSFGPTFGAAAAAGALAGLSAREARYLISYAVQQASGVSCWMRDPDHIEKAFDFGGMPARNGVGAAAMVAHGFTGVEDALAGERNFFVAYAGGARRVPRPRVLADGLGRRYEILQAAIKRWSVGSPIQAPLDALEVLMKKDSFSAKDVERVEIRVFSQGFNTTNNRDMPDICMQHLCAVMLLDGTVSFKSSHDIPRMRDPRVLAMRRRIEARGDAMLDRAMPSRQGIVEVRLRDGRRLRHHARAVRGTPENPMTRAEVEAKSLDLLAPVLGARRARRLCDAVWRIERLKDARVIGRLIAL